MLNFSTKEKALIMIAVKNLSDGLESTDVNTYLETIHQLKTIIRKIERGNIK